MDGNGSESRSNVKLPPHDLDAEEHLADHVGPGHHVLVGEHVARFVDHDARAEALGGLGSARLEQVPEEAVEEGIAEGPEGPAAAAPPALGGDVDDGGPDFLHRAHRGGATQERVVGPGAGRSEHERCEGESQDANAHGGWTLPMRADFEASQARIRRLEEQAASVAGPGPLQALPAEFERRFAELCDGFHAHGFHSAKSLRENVVKNIAAGLAKSGRKRSEFTVCAPVMAIMGDTPKEIDTMRERIRHMVGFYGSTSTYKEVLENPDYISRNALEAGLDAGTAFEILSIDIADMSVAGVEREANVGAKLQAEQADADRRRFQAEAEKRRALAVAREQEMKAVVQENQAKVVLAEAEIPKAMAEAFREGNLGIMDYYRMRNIQADTGMRDNIARGGEGNRKK